MKLIENIRRAFGRESRAITMADAMAAGLVQDGGTGAYIVPMGPDGRHDVTINTHTAMTYSAVWRCVDLLANAVAVLDWHVYRRLTGGGRERASDHALYSLLHDDFSPEVSSFDARVALMHHVLLWGRAGGEIVRTGAGEVAEVHIVEPWRWQPRRTREGELYYEVDGTRVEPRDWFHIRGLSLNGIDGLSVIGYARHSLRLGLGAEAYGNRLFANDTRPSLAIEWPGKLLPEAAQNLKQSWMNQQGGASRGQPPVLEGGAKIVPIGIPPDDAQFLETRKLQRAEVANWFSVPVQMLNDTAGSTYNNTEQKGQELITYGLMKWVKRFEGEARRKLIDPGERRFVYNEMLVDSLARADLKTRTEAYGRQIQDGWATINEIRAMENRNPVPGGDVLRVPLNLAPIDQANAEPDPNPPEPQGAAAPQRARWVRAVANQIDRHLTAATKAGQGKKLPAGDERTAWARSWAETKAADLRGDILPTLEAICGDGERAVMAFDGWLRAKAQAWFETVVETREAPRDGLAGELADGVVARLTGAEADDGSEA